MINQESIPSIKKLNIMDLQFYIPADNTLMTYFTQLFRETKKHNLTRVSLLN